jgi:hypothetical protein
LTRDEEQRYAAIIEEMRRVARDLSEPSEELQRLRNLDRAELASVGDSVLNAIVRQAEGDLTPVLERAGDAHLELRRQIVEATEQLEAEATERANQEKERFLGVRERYLEAFHGQLAGPGGTTQLKFRDVLTSQGVTQSPDCIHMNSGKLFGFIPWDPTVGPYHAVTADIASGTDAPGMWLHPKIKINTWSCDEMSSATTSQELTYRMDAPATSFGVENVRVDLIANGIASMQLGDPSSWPFVKWDPLYEHSYVKLDVLLAQEFSGDWQYWPLVSESLFLGRGNVDPRQIRAVLSGQTFPMNVFIRGSDIGGGDLLCQVHVSCSAKAYGTNSHWRLDFSAEAGLGMFVGGVALIGTSA